MSRSDKSTLPPEEREGMIKGRTADDCYYLHQLYQCPVVLLFHSSSYFSSGPARVKASCIEPWEIQLEMNCVCCRQAPKLLFKDLILGLS